MIKPPSSTDSFGYDDANRPVAVKLRPNVYAFGYDFCHVLQTLMKHGCSSAQRIHKDGSALIFIYDPQEQKAEMWSGPWKCDEPNVFSIFELEQRGLVDQTFENVEALMEFAESEPLPRIDLVPGQIQKT